MTLSIITINWNNVAGLEKTLRSVAEQTCRDFEHIIVDGASTDGSVEIIKAYAENAPYRVDWSSEPDKGIYNAMNKGIRRATGAYIQILNSGDCLAAPDVLEKMLGAYPQTEAYPQPLPKGKGDESLSQPSPEGKGFCIPDGEAPNTPPFREGMGAGSDLGIHTADPAWYEMLKGYAEENGANPTDAERVLWNALKANAIGYKFRRQHIIQDFIVDFYCNEAKLTIELDGGYHNTQKQLLSDEQRTEKLQQLGYTELRFKNEQVISDLEGVLATIRKACDTKSLPLGGDLGEAPISPPFREGQGVGFEALPFRGGLGEAPTPFPLGVALPRQTGEPGGGVKTIDGRGEAPIIYGNMVKVFPDGRRVCDKCFAGQPITMLGMYTGTLNHDPAWIRRDLFERYGYYDESLKIVSDWKWYLQALVLGANSIPPLTADEVKYVDLDVTLFDMTGISETNKNLDKAERRKVLEELVPPAILADYDRFASDIDLTKRLHRHPLAFKIVRFLERCLFKLEKSKNRRTASTQYQ